MDINYIECFLTVARTLNFSEAARKSYISQSMVSRYIGKLEEELGAKLFVRTNKAVELTAEGKTLLPYAIEIVNNIKKAKFDIEQLQNGCEGRLKIACDAAATDFVQKCVCEFSKRYPGIAIDVSELHGEGENVISENCDCVFALRDLIPDSENIDYVVTHKGTLSLAVSKDSKINKFSLDILRDEKIVMLSETENPILYMEIMDIFRAARITPHIVSRPDSVKSVMVTVGAGIGVALLPSELIKGIDFLNIRELEIKDVDTSLFYAAAWNRDTKNPATGLFTEIVKKYAMGEEDEY